MTEHTTRAEDILKDVTQGDVGSVGGVQLTPEQLANAAANLTRMREWVTDLYPLCIEYEDAVFHALASTKENESWTNFIVDIFFDIATLLAAAGAIASGGAAAVPAFAFLSAILHDWGIGKDKPGNLLDDVFATFQFGHVRMQLAIEQKLSHLVDPANNYSNLTAAWTNPIEFNGATYTIGDLASSNFPGLGDDYNALQTAAILSFQKALWNLVIMKCCSYYENYHTSVQIKKPMTLTQYAQQTFYPANKGVYLRAQLTYYDDQINEFELIYWNLGIGGNPFPDEASNILFYDDTPSHVINSDGLFNRSYVFEQFSTTKPDFSKGHELSNSPDDDFAAGDDWDFTGGVFPDLTH